MTTVSFPTTLTSIGNQAFYGCSSLDNVNLLHTNLQELGNKAFGGCLELKSITILDSLQKFDWCVFYGCSELVPSNIDVYSHNDAVVAHLRYKQRIAAEVIAPLKKIIAEQAIEITDQAAEIVALRERIAQLEI
ncbi:hypothetical protein TL16_g05115 [Triparma laevis f. inornata]|uniref:Leucine-rich repeat domain-containing protein n=1 Tax=Triparma laevis f. inornata TaxID=1714386 RepID=A0A9W7AET8_9STRA|nr:hypothetical protein TL16_g05115 [Triparma laevis f. inornata]